MEKDSLTKGAVFGRVEIVQRFTISSKENFIIRIDGIRHNGFLDRLTVIRLIRGQDSITISKKVFKYADGREFVGCKIN